MPGNTITATRRASPHPWLSAEQKKKKDKISHGELNHLAHSFVEATYILQLNKVILGECYKTRSGARKRKSSESFFHNYCLGSYFSFCFSLSFFFNSYGSFVFIAFFFLTLTIFFLRPFFYILSIYCALELYFLA